jgi:hypothetical protein
MAFPEPKARSFNKRARAREFHRIPFAINDMQQDRQLQARFSSTDLGRCSS